MVIITTTPTITTIITITVIVIVVFIIIFMKSKPILVEYDIFKMNHMFLSVLIKVTGIC